TFWKASRPTNEVSGVTATCAPDSALIVLRLVARWSAKASPMAVRRVLGSAARAWAAAPVPLPPQPMRPTLRMGAEPGVPFATGVTGRRCLLVLAQAVTRPASARVLD